MLGLYKMIVLGNFWATFQDLSNFFSFEQPEATFAFLSNLENNLATGKIAHILKSFKIIYSRRVQSVEAKVVF